VRRSWSWPTISLGGLGALALAQDHPDGVSGALAVAPCLGEPELVRSIESAGGLARWPGAAARDLEGLWSWLHATGDASRPPLWLAYGDADRYAYGHRLLAAALPPDRVRVAHGGHDWPTWQRLWAGFPASGGFPGLRSRAGASRAAILGR
jgi:S-formylglutathione hydrolase FrmB